ncbi:MAG: 50S ribosomal protein L23 [Elusimicrobia bacterium CG08_land_8_20_14_0_20_51_18]|nr:MAG: 50S ribosomal protein L23 [Elusimicrobia bacterium CG08_land_8_20_14_0_20_51_18]
MSFNPYKIIEAPLMSEKSVRLKEQNQYTFRVSTEANKHLIKKAVETIFKVKVDDVRTCNVPGKFHKVGRHEGQRPDWKKAVVTLKEGKIDFADLPK